METQDLLLRRRSRPGRRVARWGLLALVTVSALCLLGYIGARLWAQHRFHAFVAQATEFAESSGNPLVSAIKTYYRENGRWPDEYELERDLVPRYIANIDARWHFWADEQPPEVSSRLIWLGHDVFLSARFDQERWRLGSMELDVAIPP